MPRARSACASRIATSVEAALRSLARLAYEVPPRILITGSLYLAGHVLAVNGTPPRIGRSMRFAAIAECTAIIWRWRPCSPTSARKASADIVNLGDMASGPLDARRTMDMLMALDAVHVLGNHDRYLIDRPPEKMGSWDRPAHAQLDAGHLDWLRTVPPTHVYRDQVFLCHATPAHDEIYWLETVSIRTARVRMALARSDREGGRRESRSALILCGHTHLARAVRLRDGRLIVNPGSVGSPGYRDTHPYPACRRGRHAGCALRDPRTGRRRAGA